MDSLPPSSENPDRICLTISIDQADFGIGCQPIRVSRVGCRRFRNATGSMDEVGGFSRVFGRLALPQVYRRGAGTAFVELMAAIRRTA
jgi:hypothetical protein